MNITPINIPRVVYENNCYNLKTKNLTYGVIFAQKFDILTSFDIFQITFDGGQIFEIRPNRVKMSK